MDCVAPGLLQLTIEGNGRWCLLEIGRMSTKHKQNGELTQFKHRLKFAAAVL